VPKWITARRLVAVGVAAVLLAGVAGLSFFAGDGFALGGLSVRRATPGQLASAMQGDHFYSDYRENTLVVVGSVASVSGSGDTFTLEFATSGAFKALCEFQAGRPPVSVGDTITVVSAAYSAERRPSAVELTGCVLLGSAGP
jgi:hypothetical protein